MTAAYDRTWPLRVLACSVVLLLGGCGALLLIPDLLSTPSGIEGCPLVTPRVNDVIELAFIIDPGSENARQPDVVFWTVTEGQAEIADPQANPASVTFTATGTVVIEARSDGLVDVASCLTVVIPAEPE